MSLASKALNLAMNWVIWRRYRRSFKRVWRRGRLSHGWGRRRMLRLFRRERNSEEMLGWWGVLWCVWVLFEMVPCLPIPNQAATSTHVAITKLLNLNPYSHNVGSFMLWVNDLKSNMFRIQQNHEYVRFVVHTMTNNPLHSWKSDTNLHGDIYRSPFSTVLVEILGFLLSYAFLVFKNALECFVFDGSTLRVDVILSFVETLWVYIIVGWCTVISFLVHRRWKCPHSHHDLLIVTFAGILAGGLQEAISVFRSIASIQIMLYKPVSNSIVEGKCSVWKMWMVCIVLVVQLQIILFM